MNALADFLLLGIDGGGSRCRARLCNIAGVTLSEGVGGAANLRLGVEQSFASVLQATIQCMNGAGLSSRDFERVVACVALAQPARGCARARASLSHGGFRHRRPGGMRRRPWRM